MGSLFLAGLAALVSCLALTPVVRSVFTYFGLVDCPDGARKHHCRPVPRAGGIAVALSYLIAFGVVKWSHLQAQAVPDHNLSLVLKLLPAAGLIFATGLLDDLLELRPLEKMLGIGAGSALAWAAGVRLLDIAHHPISNPWAFILTVVWLAGCTNALNLIDGVDGLATGVGLFAAITTLIVGLLQGNVGL